MWVASSQRPEAMPQSSTACAASQHSDEFHLRENSTEMLMPKELPSSAFKIKQDETSLSCERDVPKRLVKLPEIQCYCFSLNKNRATINSCHGEC